MSRKKRQREDKGRNKRQTRKEKVQRSDDSRHNYEQQSEEKRRSAKPVEPLSAQTEAQAHYMMAIESSNITFGVGPAGTGKTYVCGAMGADMLMNGDVEKIILTRPAVEAGEKFGHLPGTLEEKYEEYLIPFRDVLNERLGRSRVDYLIKTGQIEAAPLAFMRGRTFNNCFIILDEAQNVSTNQMKMFLTRIGKGSTVVVNGDPKQKDIPGESGLMDAVNRLEKIGGVKSAFFDRSDVVRSGIVQQVIEAYES